MVFIIITDRRGSNDLRTYGLQLGFKIYQNGKILIQYSTCEDLSPIIGISHKASNLLEFKKVFKRPRDRHELQIYNVSIFQYVSN